MKLFFKIVLFFFLISCKNNTALKTKLSSKPNVLFIIADDLNCDLGCYGNTQVKSPNIDGLAQKGIVFENAHNQYPLCGPSRASFMSGMYTDQTKITQNNVHLRSTVPDVITIGQRFRQQGYHSVRIGKIFHYDNPSSIGTSGFDDIYSWDKTINPYGRDKLEEHKINTLSPRRYGGTLSWLAAEGEDEEQTDGIGASEAIDLLDELNLKNLIFTGHSWGGLIALDLSTKYQNEMTICMNIAYPFLVGDILLDYAKGNLDQSVEFLMKYGIYKMPETEIKTTGFGVKGSGFYGRSKGEIKSPYGTKEVESDPEREIKLYPLKRLFNQTQKEISSIDLKSCTNFRLKNDQISNIRNVKYIFCDKDKLARFDAENIILKNVNPEEDIFILKETGHFPYFEDPDQLEEVFKKILN